MKSRSGFTLVEISIVMIIVGLLIGGTFGGMKLIENMQVNKTVQDLKAIDSAALTFKDTYGRLPGDLRNPSTRLPNCTTAPCSTTGDGDRTIDPPSSATAWTAAQDATYERFTFWSHLQAADVLSVGVKNTTNMDFGEGQPQAGVDAGYRVTEFTALGGCGTIPFNNGIILIATDPSADMNTPGVSLIPCQQMRSIDNKIDDGQPTNGRMLNHGCGSDNTCTATYVITNTGHIFYDAKF